MTQTSSHTRADLRGILFMVLSMGSFIVNDSFLKVVIGNLPPFEALFFRGIASILWGVPLLALTGGIKALPLVADKRVLFRNAFEMIAVIGYVLGLASAPIADLTAGIAIEDVELDNVFTGWSGEAVIAWPEYRLELAMSASAPLRFLVVYVPGNESYFCAEPVSNSTDAFNLGRSRDDTGMLVLEPGDQARATIRFTLRPMAS